MQLAKTILFAYFQKLITKASKHVPSAIKSMLNVVEAAKRVSFGALADKQGQELSGPQAAQNLRLIMEREDVGVSHLCDSYSPMRSLWICF